MKSDLAIIAQKTGRSPVEDLDSPFSTFGEVQPTAATAETSAKTQIEVIKGSGVFCQALPPLLLPWCGICCWAPFDLETLLKSNLKDATLKKWPAASRGQIGKSINSKLTELRRSTR
ncbi:uncharacterized protein LOC143735538 [Siphateles boraxobius]|uniref:uncharacterized protein LOC143735538 n=1 Tax=Siphateles boraxobius TaxID=180520 RepID=UPI004062D9F4